MRVLQSFVALTALLVTIAPVNVAAQCRTFTVRKELNDMTAQDWAVYKSTILRAHATPDPNDPRYSIWEYGAYLHNQVANVIHGNCQFLFWHRMFTRWMEQRLQAIDSRFQFFYWDSARQWRNPTASTIFTHFGTSGRPVRDGFLANAFFKTTNSYLTRNFRFPDMGGILPSLETYTQLQIDSGRQGGFSFYASRMELFHGQMHVLLGGPGESGQIQSMHSPNDPFFYSHHSHIDWLWFNAQASWINQGRGPEYQIGGLDDRNMTCTLNNRLAGFQSVFADVLDLRRMCVRYLMPGQSAGAQPGGVVPGGVMPGGVVPGGVIPGGVVPGGVIPGGLPPGSGLPEQRRSLVSVPSGGTVSLNSAAISPNSIGGGSPYGEQLVPYQLPSGYHKMDQCPQALPPWWLARNFRNPDASSLCESIRARCEELRAQIASGQQTAPFTIINDSIDRIPMTSIIDINAPRAAPMNVPLQPHIDPGYFAHDGPIYSAAQTVLLSPNTRKIGWAFAPLVAGILALVL